MLKINEYQTIEKSNYSFNIIRDEIGYFVGAFFHANRYGLNVSIDKAYRTYRGAYNAGMRVLNKYIGQRDKANKYRDWETIAIISELGPIVSSGAQIAVIS